MTEAFKTYTFTAEWDETSQQWAVVAKQWGTRFELCIMGETLIDALGKAQDQVSKHLETVKEWMENEERYISGFCGKKMSTL